MRVKVKAGVVFPVERVVPSMRVSIGDLVSGGDWRQASTSAESGGGKGHVNPPCLDLE